MLKLLFDQWCSCTDTEFDFVFFWTVLWQNWYDTRWNQQGPFGRRCHLIIIITTPTSRAEKKCPGIINADFIERTGTPRQITWGKHTCRHKQPARDQSSMLQCWAYSRSSASSTATAWWAVEREEKASRTVYQEMQDWWGNTKGMLEGCY